MSAGAAFRAESDNTSATRRIGQLFLVGSVLFAIGSLPGGREVTLVGTAGTLFIGSVLFTSAAAEQLRTSEGDPLDIGSAAVQLAGTIMFNMNTFAAFDGRLETRSLDFLVWLPNAIGSIAFLVCSVMAVAAVRGQERATKRIANLNLLGSVAFGVSAAAAYIRPSTEAAINQTVSSWGTLIGAVCFGVAAWLLIRSTVPSSARAD